MTIANINKNRNTTIRMIEAVLDNGLEAAGIGPSGMGVGVGAGLAGVGAGLGAGVGSGIVVGVVVTVVP
jgi:hypothetical protein